MTRSVGRQPRRPKVLYHDLSEEREVELYLEPFGIKDKKCEASIQ